MNPLLERTRALYPARKDLKDGLHRHPELSCCPSPRCHVLERLGFVNPNHNLSD